jgi:hypothetical protein
MQSSRNLAAPLVGAGVVALVALACAESGGPAPHDMSGRWAYTERLEDQLNGIVCSDTGDYVFTQNGTAFTGTYFQRGVCLVATGGGFFNSDSGMVDSGRVVGNTVRFHATPQCQYAGALTGTPADRVSGDGYCTVTLGTRTLSFAGRWDAMRVAP